MVHKPISYSTWEQLKKLSFNEFNRWFLKCQEEQKEVAIDIAITEVKKQVLGDPDAAFIVWDLDALREKFTEMGLARRTIEQIMEILVE